AGAGDREGLSVPHSFSRSPSRGASPGGGAPREASPRRHPPPRGRRGGGSTGAHLRARGSGLQGGGGRGSRGGGEDRGPAREGGGALHPRDRSRHAYVRGLVLS